MKLLLVTSVILSLGLFSSVLAEGSDDVYLTKKHRSLGESIYHSVNSYRESINQEPIEPPNNGQANIRSTHDGGQFLKWYRDEVAPLVESYGGDPEWGYIFSVVSNYYRESPEEMSLGEITQKIRKDLDNNGLLRSVIDMRIAKYVPPPMPPKKNSNFARAGTSSSRISELKALPISCVAHDQYWAEVAAEEKQRLAQETEDWETYEYNEGASPQLDRFSVSISTDLGNKELKDQIFSGSYRDERIHVIQKLRDDLNDKRLELQGLVYSICGVPPEPVPLQDYRVREFNVSQMLRNTLGAFTNYQAQKRQTDPNMVIMPGPSSKTEAHWDEHTEHGNTNPMAMFHKCKSEVEVAELTQSSPAENASAPSGPPRGGAYGQLKTFGGTSSSRTVTMSLTALKIAHDDGAGHTCRLSISTDTPDWTNHRDQSFSMNIDLNSYYNGRYSGRMVEVGGEAVSRQSPILLSCALSESFTNKEFTNNCNFISKLPAVKKAPANTSSPLLNILFSGEGEADQ